MTSRRLPLRHVKHTFDRVQRGHRFVLPHVPFIRFSFRFLAVVFIFTLIILGFRLISQSKWNGKDRITFALATSPDGTDGEVYLVSYLPAEQLSVVALPSALQIEAVGGFGPWRVGSLYKLGELEGRGGALLSGTLAEFFGVGVDGWIVFSGKVEVSGETAKAALRPLLLKPVFGRGRTNLGLWDLLRLWSSIGSVRASSAEVVELSSIGVLHEEILPDGSKAYRTDPEWLDQLARRLLASPELSREGLAIAVLNATEHQRLGNRATRVVENMGGNVVSVSDFPTIEERSTIIVSNDSLRSSITVSELSKFFSVGKVSVGETMDRRADLLLVIGEEYWRKLTEF